MSERRPRERRERGLGRASSAGEESEPRAASAATDDTRAASREADRRETSKRATRERSDPRAASAATRERVSARSDRRVARTGLDEIRRPPRVAKSARRRSSVQEYGESDGPWSRSGWCSQEPKSLERPTTPSPVCTYGGSRGCTGVGGAGSLGPSVVFASGVPPTSTGVGRPQPRVRHSDGVHLSISSPGIYGSVYRSQVSEHAPGSHEKFHGAWTRWHEGCVPTGATIMLLVQQANGGRTMPIGRVLDGRARNE